MGLGREAKEGRKKRRGEQSGGKRGDSEEVGRREQRTSAEERRRKRQRRMRKLGEEQRNRAKATSFSFSHEDVNHCTKHAARQREGSRANRGQPLGFSFSSLNNHRVRKGTSFPWGRICSCKINKFVKSHQVRQTLFQQARQTHKPQGPALSAELAPAKSLFGIESTREGHHTSESLGMGCSNASLDLDAPQSLLRAQTGTLSSHGLPTGEGIPLPAEEAA
eukprot:2532133-Rhodomonas_salina.3